MIFEDVAPKNSNLFRNFDKWTKIHYYALKNRCNYPNLFFNYFSKDGDVNDYFSEEDRKEILSLIKKYGDKVNGNWGLISVSLKNKNGISIYKMINSSAFYNSTFSVGLFQSANYTIWVDYKVFYF